MTSDAAPDVPTRVLGRTGERVSAIGLGGWHLALPHVDAALDAALRRAPQRRRRGLVRGVQAEHVDPPGIRGPQALDALDGGRLPGAVRPEDAEDLPLADLEGDVRDRLQVAVALRQGLHLEHHAGTPAACNTRATASGASHGTTCRSAMPRNQVSCRLASWRVAAMPRSRTPSSGHCPSSASHAWR